LIERGFICHCLLTIGVV